MKRIKKILKISGISLLIIIILMIIIPFAFKGKILTIAKEQANANLNAKVDFDDLSLSLFRSFPSLNIRLNKVSVVGINDFENDTLVSFDEFSVDVNTLSVLSDQIKIKAIVLNQPKIYVKVLKNGAANYDIAKEDSIDNEEINENENSEESKFAIGLKKFEINNAALIYDDAESDVYAQIENLNFELSGDMTQDLTNLSLLTTIDSLTVKSDGVKYIKKAALSFKSDLEANLKESKYTFKENLFKINEFTLGFDGFVAMPDTNIDMDIIFKTEQTEFKSILSMVPAVYMKDFEGVETNGTFSFNGYAKGTYNAISVPEFGLNFIVKNAMFKYPDLPKSVHNINIDIQIENPGDIDINIVDVNKFHLEIAENPIDANLHVKTSAADVNIAGEINMNLLLESLQDVMMLDEGMSVSGNVNAAVKFAGNLSSIENEKYDEFMADGNLNLNNIKTIMEDMPPIVIEKSQLIFSPQYANLEYFDMKIGSSDMHLNGTINNILQYVFNDQVLVADFNFSSTYFNANEFLSGEESTDEEVSVEDTSTITAFEIPKNIDFKLKSNLNKVLYDKLEITNIIGLITLKNSRLGLDNLKMNLLDGRLVTTGSYNSENIKNPEADFLFQMDNIDITKTFESFESVQRLAPFAKYCNGRINLILDFTTTLDYFMNPVYNTLNGNGGFSSQSIEIKNNKLFSSLGEKTKIKSLQQPALKDVDVQFTIEDGNIIIEPTTFNMNGSEASVQGTTNLDKTINYQIGMNVPKNTANSLLNKVADNELSDNLKIYATIGGTIDDPKITGFNSSITDAVKDKIEDLKDELSEKALQYIEEIDEKAEKLVENAKAKRDSLIKKAEQESIKLKAKAKETSEQILAEANKKADELVAKAKNPVAKIAAEKAAEKLKDEAKIKAEKSLNKSNQEIDNMLNKTKNEANEMVLKAEKEADEMKTQAREKAKNM